MRQVDKSFVSTENGNKANNQTKKEITILARSIFILLYKKWLNAIISKRYVKRNKRCSYLNFELIIITQKNYNMKFNLVIIFYDIKIIYIISFQKYTYTS